MLWNKGELFWWYNAERCPCCLLLPVASPNDLNLGTLVASEPRLNPGFTSWGDFVGSTVGRVQQTVIHSDPLGSDPANGYTTYITQVLSDTLLFLLAPKNTTFFVFFLKVLFSVATLSNAGHHCSTTSSSVRGPQPPSRAVPCRCCGEAVCGFLRSPNCGNIQAEAREMSSKLSQDPEGLCFFMSNL